MFVVLLKSMLMPPAAADEINELKSYLISSSHSTSAAAATPAATDTVTAPYPWDSSPQLYK
jgi:hypothetical protein